MIYIGLFFAGAAMAFGGRRLLRKFEQKPEGTIDEGVRGTLRAAGGLAACALMLLGVVLCGMSLYLPTILK